VLHLQLKELDGQRPSSWARTAQYQRTAAYGYCTFRTLSNIRSGSDRISGQHSSPMQNAAKGGAKVHDVPYQVRRLPRTVVGAQDGGPEKGLSASNQVVGSSVWNIFLTVSLRMDCGDLTEVQIDVLPLDNCNSLIGLSPPSSLPCLTEARSESYPSISASSMSGPAFPF